MKLSSYFVRTLKQAPKDAQTINNSLLVRAGYVRQLMAGVYTYLPLGLRVLNKIQDIVREEMNDIGASEVLMPLLHPSKIWKTTGGWENIDVLFKIKSRTKKEYALAQSNEETVTPLALEFVKSYKDLPLAIYHINWKFRDELRSKSGILRGREFLMKDMYSFHIDQKDFEDFYQKAKSAYLKIFKRMDLTPKVTEASGGGFSEKISYEFEVLSSAGEANILFCENCDYCLNLDDIKKYKKNDLCPSCGKNKLKQATAAEVGNVFDLGQKYTKAFGLIVTDQNGLKKYPIMGCYGIGISRTMGVLVEKFHDEKGIVWPKSVAPFDIHLVGLNGKGEELYNHLKSLNVDVLFDDRDLPAGEKFADADLIGIPVRLIVSERTKDKIEYKLRNQADSQLINIDQLTAIIKK